MLAKAGKNADKNALTERFFKSHENINNGGNTVANTI